MSQTPNADSGRDTFTCGTMFMCLNLPGLSKKKRESKEESRPPPPLATEQDQPAAAVAEQEPVPGRAASTEKLESSSLYSGSNMGFDLPVEPDLGEDRGGRPVLAYCPSPCFDLPVELMRAGERGDSPVTAAFVFDGYPRGALKKVASCLPPGVVGGDGESRQPHLVRFLSNSTAPANGGLP
uniref:Uncharacterized protein n=1 Tax=Leersia perrieri TaxID=77586 RepID=A0A0D9V6R7_9ORYZ